MPRGVVEQIAFGNFQPGLQLAVIELVQILLLISDPSRLSPCVRGP